MFRSTGVTRAGSPTEKKTRRALWALALFMALAALLFTPLQARAAGVTFTAVAGSSNSGYGQGSDGNIYAWGQNTYGQLGNNSNADSQVPVQVNTSNLPAGVTFTAVSASYSSGCALGSDGNIYAWGRNNFGQLGNNSTADSLVPVPVNTPSGVPPGFTFTAVTVNATNGYALGSNGKIYAWGQGNYGQLGNGSTTNSLLPVQVSVPASAPAGFTFTAVADSTYSGYGLGSDGNIYAWGRNNNGQLGNNSTTNSLLPVQVSVPASAPAGFTFTAVAGGDYAGYGLGSDGNIYAWGFNYYGQLGNNSTTNSPVPVPVNTPAGVPAGFTFTAVAGSKQSSGGSAYGLGSDGNIYAWGTNNYGQLGNNATAQSLVPVWVDTSTLPAGVTFTAVAAGANSGYGLGSDGKIYGWGSGSLGNNSNANSPVPVPVFMADWGISLTVPGIVSETYTVTARTYGYATLPSEPVTVINIGNQDTGALAVGLSGADANKFELSTESLPNLTTTAGSNSTIFTVSPISGLDAGTYTATVTVNAAAGNTNPIEPQTFDVSFTVNPAMPAPTDFSFTPASATYDGGAHPVTVSPLASVTGMGAITAVYYNGSTTEPTAAGTYEITIDVDDGANYAAATGLSLGNFAIDAADQTITFGATSPVVVAGTATVTASTTAMPAASYPITFSSTSTGCTVTSAGVVTGVHAGTNNCVITATQAGDGNYSSASNTQTLSIAQDPTPAVTLSATPNPATVGASVTITATVAGDPPTGNVTFCDGATTTDATCTGGTVLCSAVTLVPATLNSTASCAHTFSSAGAQTITALYSGDADFAQAETALALSLNVVALNSGGGAVAIPTLSQWALALLALLLAGGAVVHSRRARRGS